MVEVNLVQLPAFEVTFDQKLVDVLLTLCSYHYDGQCRSAGRHGGIIYGWNNALTFPDSQEVKRVLSFREMDLVMKVCEVADYPKFLSKKQKPLIDRLRNQFRQAYQQSIS